MCADYFRRRFNHLRSRVLVLHRSDCRFGCAKGRWSFPNRCFRASRLFEQAVHDDFVELARNNISFSFGKPWYERAVTFLCSKDPFEQSQILELVEEVASYSALGVGTDDRLAEYEDDDETFSDEAASI